MKRLLFLSLIMFSVIAMQAQDTTDVKVMTKKLVEVTEDAEHTEVSLLNDRINIRDNYHGDTTNIRVGRRNIEIVEGDHKTYVNIRREDRWDDDSEWRDHKRKRFNGHWSGLELGVNGLAKVDYGLYGAGADEFMELDQPKSLEVNLNFIEYNISLKDERVGLVTGMGFSMNNYRFDNQLTIDKAEDGLVRPFPVAEDNFEKSKLVVSYLTVPLMLEFQVPVNGKSNQLFISGGMVGGINLGSHTKIKADNSKTKDRGSFNINPFKYAAVARVGLKDISLYATYSLAPLFKDDKGPELFPFSIGISLVNF